MASVHRHYSETWHTDSVTSVARSSHTSGACGITLHLFTEQHSWCQCDMCGKKVTHKECPRHHLVSVHRAARSTSGVGMISRTACALTPAARTAGVSVTGVAKS